MPLHGTVTHANVAAPRPSVILTSYPKDVAISVDTVAANRFNPLSMKFFGWSSAGRWAPLIVLLSSFLASKELFDGRFDDA